MYWQGRRQSSNVEIASPLASALAQAQARQEAVRSQMERGLASRGLFAPTQIANVQDPITGAVNWSRMNMPGNFANTTAFARGVRDAAPPQPGFTRGGLFGAGFIPAPAPTQGLGGLLGSFGPGAAASSAPSFGGLFSGMFESPTVGNDPGYGGAGRGGKGGKK